MISTVILFVEVQYYTVDLLYNHLIIIRNLRFRQIYLILRSRVQPHPFFKLNFAASKARRMKYEITPPFKNECIAVFRKCFWGNSAALARGMLRWKKPRYRSTRVRSSHVRSTFQSRRRGCSYNDWAKNRKNSKDFRDTKSLEVDRRVELCY